MPIYCYICSVCGRSFEEFARYGEHIEYCSECGGRLDRDYRSEFGSVNVEVDDWGPGWNAGIGEYYENRADLIRKIRARGLEPMYHSAGLVRVRRPLYVDELRGGEVKPADDVEIE